MRKRDVIKTAVAIPFYIVGGVCLTVGFSSLMVAAFVLHGLD